MAHSIPARLTGPYTAAAGRRFGFTVGAAFLVFAGIAFWRGHPTVTTILAALGGTLGLGALVAPASLGPVERAWMRLALAISKVTTPIFMGVLYFLVLTPAGILRRTLGSNPLVHRPAAGGGVWADRSESSRSNLERLF